MCSPPNRLQSRPGKWISLGDLTADLTRPCVLDIKIGRIQHTPDFSEAKRLESLEKVFFVCFCLFFLVGSARVDCVFARFFSQCVCSSSHCAQVNSSTSRTLGLRICGMKLWSHRTNQASSATKNWGKKSVTESNFTAALARFVDDEHVDGPRRSLPPLFADRVSALVDAIESTDHQLRWISTSVLLLYDSAATTEEALQRSASVHLIDFANTWPAAESFSKDEVGFEDGLRTLASKLREVTAYNCWPTTYEYPPLL